MALLNGFMPGEWDWQNQQDYPTGGMLSSGGWQDRISGALNGNNPLFNIGLGILANNNSKNLGTVLGQGITAGVQNTQRAQQLSQQKLLQDQQLKDYALKQKEYERKQKAIDAFKVNHPELADVVDLNPDLAIKAGYPQIAAKSETPYFQDRYIGGKVYSFDARTGDFIEKNLGGTSNLPNKDDPTIRGAVKSAESGAAAAFKPNTDIPGQVLTDEQVARMSYGNNPMPYQRQQGLPQPVNGRIPAQQMPTNNFNTPYPVTFGAPGTTATDQREGTMTDASVAVRNPSRPNVQGSYAPQTGIRVPTPAEQAALTEQAKAQVDINKTSALNDQKQQQSASKGQRGLDAMMKYLYKDGVPTRDENGRLIPPKDIPILGNSIADRAAMMGHEYGLHNDKASNIIGARRLINSLVLDANNGSLGAGVSNADVQFLQKIQGVVDSPQDPKDVYNAIADNEERFNRILGIAKQQGTNTAAPVGGQRRRVFNPKTGRIE